MSVLVIGGGAVGSYVAGLMAAGGTPVSLVARGSHGNAIRARGLTLTRGSTSRRVELAIHESIGSALQDEAFLMAVVAVKSYHTAGVAAEIEAAGSSPALLSLQNGMGNEGRLAALLPESRVIAGTLTTAVWLPAPGIVESSRKGGFGLEWCSESEAVGQTLSAGGATVELYYDPTAMKWSKLLLNMLGNATAAILGWPPERVFADRRLYGLERAAWLEALAVIQAAGSNPVNLPGYRVSALARSVRLLPADVLWPLARIGVAGGRGGKIPGIAQDLARSRHQTEVGVLNGAVAERGSELGIPTPVNAALTRLVNGLADGSVPRETLRGAPEALLAAVAGQR